MVISLSIEGQQGLLLIRLHVVPHVKAHACIIISGRVGGRKVQLRLASVAASSKAKGDCWLVTIKLLLLFELLGLLLFKHLRSS